MGKPLILPVCLGVAILAGLGVWALWPSDEPVIAVPDRVCGGALPGGPVGDLLPERGKGFEEELVGSSSPGSISPVWKCRVLGGGQSVYLAYSPILDPADYGPEDITRDARKPGNVPLSWGTNKGYVEGKTVSLFVGCENSDGGDVLLEVSATVNRGERNLTDATTRGKAVALAADTARFAAPRVEVCKPGTLPETAPEIG
ncbi:hypothetical protein [Streptomyces sp. NPDC050428]|uniref:hypothetical protein n=1 Tax=Streptomyces sp. NPDC050428 TaxID=3155757 RepID=UPI0034251ABB